MTFTVFTCGVKRASCSSHDCSRPSAAKCQHPVKRDGEQTECLRAVCLGCVVAVEGKTYCAAHGRVVSRKP